MFPRTEDTGTETGRRTPDGHVPALDGLRGLAILFVVAFHSAYISDPSGAAEISFSRVVRFGWIGVDAFFVLSGFLITSILLRSRGERRGLRNFYGRRVLRIFPLYYTFLLIVFVAVPAVHGLEIGHSLRANSLWYLTFTTNLLAANAGSWAALPAGTSHLWSLAVEEQFYLVWPLIVLKMAPRKLLHLSFGVVALALIVRVGVHAVGAGLPTRIALYVLPPTHIDGLMLGAVLAVLAASGRGLSPHLGWIRLIGAVGFTIALGCHVIWGRASSALSAPMQTVGYTALAFGLAVPVAICAAQSSRSVLIRVCEWRSLRAFGRYSFAIYLFHYPLTAALESRMALPSVLAGLLGGRVVGRVAFFLVVLLASTVLAMVAWHLVERPFLRLKVRFPRVPNHNDVKKQVIPLA